MKPSVMPVISIIVPIYNVEIYVNNCIDSILAQKYDNLELILIDDGSPDDCGSIIDSYAQKDNRILVVHQGNKGLSAARNIGLDIATGSLIGFVDGDDWIDESMYYDLYKNLASSDADISICGVKVVYEDDFIIVDDSNWVDEKVCFDLYNKYLTSCDKSQNSIIISNKLDIMKYYLGYGYAFATNKLYKKALFDKIRFPVGKMYEDMYIAYRIMDRAKRIVSTSEKMYNYVQRQNSISKTEFSYKNFNGIEAFIEMYQYLSSRYPEIETVVRRNMFKMIINTFSRLFLESDFKIYKKEIEEIINYTRRISIENCDLLPDYKYLARLLLFDFNPRDYQIVAKVIRNTVEKKATLPESLLE